MNIQGTARDLAKKIASQHVVSATPQSATNDGKWWQASYVTAESGANLSQIQIGPNIYRNVPRLINAWTTTPSAGASLLVLQYGGSFVIHGQIIGQPELATDIGAGG